jgi:PAT family beta-lactamase induction signal transducer AmpG
MADEGSTKISPARKTGGSAISWWESIAEYGHPRVVGMLFLGFSAGLPFLLVFSTLSAWLSDVGVSRTTIGFFAWIGITYSIKVIWAPLVDRLELPFLTRFLGKRRSWMLLGQLGIATGLTAMALIDPSSNLALFAFIAFLVAFSSATQDVALDAYRIEAVERRYQGPMAGNYQTGYRIGLLMAGAGALFIADVASFQIAYIAMAVLMSVGIVTVLLLDEPEVDAEAGRLRDADLVTAISGFGHGKRQLNDLQKWILGAVVNPFLDFFRRTGRWAFVILAFIAVYRISDLVMGIMANPFYLELGFTKSEIAAIAKAFGIAMTIVGAVTGGLLVARYSAVRMLVVGAVLVAATNLLFAQLAVIGADKSFLAVTISADNFSAGFAGSVFIAFLSSLTSSTYTATQYALFSSLMTLPGKIISGFSGMIVDAHDYQWFFFYAAVMGIPAIILSLVIMWWSSKTMQQND